MKKHLISILLPLLSCVVIGCGGGSDSGNVVGDVTQQNSVALTNLPSPTTPVQTTFRAVEAFPSLNFQTPSVITQAGDGSNRLFIAELNGVIRVVDNNPNASLSRTFLDISAQVQTGAERGFLGMAFHPNYANNGFFYVSYTAPPTSGSHDSISVISRFTVSADPNVADASSELKLLEFEQPFSNHNGGCLAFGPDGMLYIGSGDGGGSGDPGNNAQDVDNLLGKILRIAGDGSVPADNPFVGQPGDDRIWAYGLRNPWRFSFDFVTGQLFAGDVGELRREEIDIIERGGNYGWKLFEGELEFENPGSVALGSTQGPLFTYDRSVGRSITGGVVYRGTAHPSLVGKYIYGDFGSGRVFALTLNGQQVVSNEELFTVPQIITFGEDQSGEILMSSFDGSVFKLEAGN